MGRTCLHAIQEPIMLSYKKTPSYFVCTFDTEY